MSIKEQIYRLAGSKYRQSKVLSEMIEVLASDSRFDAWLAITVKQKYPERMIDLIVFCEEYEYEIEKILERLYAEGGVEECASDLRKIRQKITDKSLLSDTQLNVAGGT